MLIRLTLVAVSLWALLSYNIAHASFSDTIDKTLKSVCHVAVDNNTTLPESANKNPFNEYLKKPQQVLPQEVLVRVLLLF